MKVITCLVEGLWEAQGSHRCTEVEHALARLRVQDVADNGGGKVLRKEDCRETVE